jgi:ABC-2 type transport system ATP-binding protein
VNVIEAQMLGKRYGHTWALHNCTLAVPSNRAVALVGPNGAGKTTLLHLAVGLTAASAGRVTVLDGLTPEPKRRGSGSGLSLRIPRST